MNSTQLNIVKALIEQKKYDVITEYTHIAHPDKGDIIVKEYAGTGVRVYKDNDGNTRVLCPKDIDTVQEGHVAQAIANGTIFDDADEIDRNATMIERTSIPYDAMVNSGKDTPKQLKPMIAIVIGRMDDNGSFDVSDADRTNGVNFVHDLCDKEKCPNTNDVVDNYLEKDKEDFYNPEMGKSLTELDNEVDDIVETKPEDVVTNDDTVDSYDDYDMDAIESDPTPENDETESDEEDGDNDDDSDGTDSNDSDNDDDESEDNESSDNDDEEAVIEDVDDDDEDDESVEECGDIDTVQEDTEEMAAMVSGAMNKTPIPAESDLKPIQEEDEMVDDGGSDDTGADTGDDGGDITEEACSPATGATTDSPTESTDAKGNVNTTPMPMSAQTKAIVNSNPKMHQEGFLSKKPKKLKPIGRDVVAYITCEMNDIRSANDQAMLAGYTCSKIELVDFYLTVLDTQDARYIVPHNKQYLTQMKSDLEKLLTQILRIRPINRSEQIWRVNYPGSAV